MKRLLFLLLLLPVFTNAQTITTIIGNGTAGYTGNGGPASTAILHNPLDVVFDNSGNMYIVDDHNYCIRKVNTSGIISAYAGNGVTGYSGDGGPATAAELGIPGMIAFDGAGNAYIADFGDDVIRKVDTSGIITTFAGNNIVGYSGDGGPATAAELFSPNYVATDGNGNLFISDYLRIRKVNSSGMISTVAGGATQGYSGDGGPATAAEINGSAGVLVNGSNNIYILDGGNYRIRKVNSSGIITTIAGNGTSGYSGDGGPATAAEIGNAAGSLSFDAHGNLYFADGYTNNVIRKINLSSRIINTIAGNGTAGFSGDGGPATACELNGPEGIGFDSLGNAYVADYNNNRIRKITGLFLAVNNIPALVETKIYPNPASTCLTIQLADQQINQITITDLMGQTISSNRYNSSQVQVDVADLPKGIYLIRINGSEVKKFVKQ